ncbi:Long-chain fatty acid transport protein 1 [Eumeta japonica]|uniref:Very long-chain fatty acid transport protein n=1 Tax=Eumeta variegata TaxID=151549 RepID=A0A4C1XIF8_EUMVA|nr:Long-chain fatty acid transport protein 1 [Eumeta japonica]
MPKSVRKADDEIKQALEEVMVKKKSIRSVARDRDISKSLQYKIVMKAKEDGENLKYGRNIGNRKIFRPEQERLLASYLKTASKMCDGLAKIQTREFGFYCLYANHIIRLGIVYPALIEVVLLSFTAVEKHYKKYEFSPNMIWNIVETSCMTAIKTPKIIATRGAKQVGQITSAEREDSGDITIHIALDDNDLTMLTELVGREQNLQKDKDDCVCHICNRVYSASQGEWLACKFFSKWGLRVLVSARVRVWMWEKHGAGVVSVWSKVCVQHADKKALIMGDRALTFSEGDALSNRVAWYFKRQGFKRGEVIAVYMETQPEYVFIWLGLAKLGVIGSLVNSNLRGAQLLHCLRVASCKALIYGDEMTEAIKEIQDELRDMPLFQYNSLDRETAEIIENATPLAAELKEMPSDAVTDAVATKPRDTLLYIYTSGTTGFPKAAIITNIKYLVFASCIQTSGRLKSSDVVYNPLPLHHTAGGVLGVGQALAHGSTVVLRKKFSASNYWQDVAKYECTVAQYIGEICRYLLAVPPGPADRAHKVRMIVGNGLRPHIWEQFVQRFSIHRVLEFYGATEGNSSLVNLDSKVGAVGFLSRLVSFIYPLILVKCDQMTGEILRDNNGLCVPCEPQEPDKTASEKKMVRNVRKHGDCYFNTGDILVMDHYGYFYFRDRTGDTFRWRGENVSTAEMESVISSLIGLKDTIMFGVTIPNVEGKAGLVAIADPDNKLNLDVLSRGLQSNLPTYARPLFLRILTKTPVTATFKLKKKELLEQGFDPQLHKDPMYFLDQKSGCYVPLTRRLYEDIIQGVVKL